MPDKTPLELARRIVNAECPSGMGWTEVSKKVAAALIEKMTPVEISEHAWMTSNNCPSCCKYGLRYGLMCLDNFCPNCGVPIKWT